MEYEYICLNCGSDTPFGVDCPDHYLAPVEPNLYDLCCGMCPPGLCYIDEMTGA